MTPHPLSAVAVVNADANMVAIWHVAAEPIAQTARLCGAWVTDDLDVQQKVVAARGVVVVGSAPAQRIRPLLSHAGGVIDVEATLEAIEQYTVGLDEIQHASLTPNGNRRAPISWPNQPQVLDWVNLPPVPAGVVEDPFIRSTIAVARWLAGLAETWSAIETIRTSKAHLSAGNPSPLPVPFVFG